MTYLARWQRVRMAVNSRRKIYPPRVESYDYWSDPPPVLSPRCLHWAKRIKDGWRPGRNIRNGYDGNAHYLGVYIWEYLHIIAPMLSGGRRDVAGPAWDVGPEGRPVQVSYP